MISADQVSFLTWALSTLHSMQTQQLLVYLVVGCFGIFAHYFKKWFTDEIVGSFYQYIVGDHPKETIITILSFVGSSVAYIYSGAMVGSGWPAIIGLAFTTGYSLDSAFNKGKSKKIETEG